MVEPIVLTPKEAAFVREYLACHSPMKAYIAAGYSPNGARTNGPKLLLKYHIWQAIAAGEAEAAKRAELTLDDLVANYTRLGMTGMSRFLRIDTDGQPVIDLSGCTPKDLDVLAEVTIETFTEGKGDAAREVKRIKIKPYDRFTALAQLAKYLGMFAKLEGEATDTLSELLKQIMERGSTLPVKPQGPLGSGGNGGKPRKN